MSALEGFLLCGLLAAGLAPFVVRLLGNAAGWLLALVPGSAFVWGLTLLGKEPFAISRPWVEELGINFAFRLDGLSLFFWLLISGIGALIFIYAAGYMKKDLGRLLSYLFLFMVAMLGLVSASDLITLFVFWEATSITSFLLIGFSHENPTARKSALQALLITGSGGLLLLAGFLILGSQNGTYNLAAITQYSPAAFWLILLGAMTKSAQFPFHFWLPNAMSAPTPVSAYLHSATMVKAGVFLLAKFSPIFGSQPPIIVVGAITFVLGSILSLFETDLKRILAWSTVGALGSMVMLIGIGTEKAALALSVTILAHAAYKGALFMVAGTIDITAGSRDVTKLSGLGKHARILWGFALIAAASMSGLIPFLGFVKKEVQLAAALSFLITLAIIIGGACSVVAAANVALRPFLGKSESAPAKANLGLLLGTMVLGLVSLLGGLGVAMLGSQLLEPVAVSVTGNQVSEHLALWHGFNTEFVLSLLAIAIGVAMAFIAPRLWALGNNFKAQPFTTESISAGIFRLVHPVGKFTSNLIEKNSFRRHLLVYFGSFVVIAAIAFFMSPFDVRHVPEPRIIWYETAFCLFAMIAALAVIRMKSRLGAVAVLGIVGVAITLTYATYSAPDLALTQLLIEILSVVLFVLVFFHLPRFTQMSQRDNKIRDAIIAGAFGLVMTVVCLGVLNEPNPQRLSEYFAQTSYDKAQGKNVVNTIIVDYRGLDTLGEITVLAVAALGVHALLKLLPKTKENQS